jgi:selenocysteine lyase/cysteine desulfurase
MSSPSNQQRIRYNEFKDCEGFFNSAWYGRPSKQADYAAQEAIKNAKQGKLPPDIWRTSIEEAKLQLSILLNQPAHSFTIFHNTTAGVQRIFLRLRDLMSSHDATLLISDLEYPGIVSLVDENWHGRLVMAEVANLIWDRKQSQVQRLLERSINVSRPSVVYLSHVARTNGYCLDESLLTYIRDVNPRAIIVIDGAQAIGNICVPPSFLEKVDFYVTSGHKWLSTRQTMGIVYAHDRWKIPDPAQSYSMNAGSGGTGNLATLCSLPPAVKDFNGALAGVTSIQQMQVIEDNNAGLAKEFAAAMAKLGLACVGAEDQISSDYEWRWNGLVTIQNAPERLVTSLSKNGTITALAPEEWRDQVGGRPRSPRFLLKCDADTGGVVFTEVDLRERMVPIPPVGCLRFCFHYYHNTKNVQQLAGRISSLR